MQILDRSVTFTRSGRTNDKWHLPEYHLFTILESNAIPETKHFQKRSWLDKWLERHEEMKY